MNPLSFYLITDPHYFAPELGVGTKSYEFRNSEDTCVIAESVAIIDATIDFILADKDVDIVLIPGDLTHDGEMASHRGLLKKLQRLVDGGKRVFITFATHDYTYYEKYDFSRSTHGYWLDERIEAQGTDRSSLEKMYREYGFSKAIDYDDDSQSYSVMLADDVRLLALNDDGNTRTFFGFSNVTMQWIENQVKQARENGEFVFAMTHHPILPPASLYAGLSSSDMLGDYRNTAEAFAEIGLEVVFTGHSHIQYAHKYTSKKGKPFYNIGTGALVAAPAPIRKVEMSGNTMQIETLSLPDEICTIDGVSCNEMMDKKFDKLIYGLVDSAKNDFDVFASMVNGFSVRRHHIEPFKKVIPVVGKVIDSLRVGSVADKLSIKTEYESIRNKKVLDLVADITRGFFVGERVTTPDTVEYKVVMESVLKVKHYLSKFGLAKDNELLEKIPHYLHALMADGGIGHNTCTIKLTQKSMFDKLEK